MVAKALGYRTHHRHPAHPEPGEEGRHPALLGAELVEVDAVPYSNPTIMCSYSGRLAEELDARRARRRDLGQPVRQRRQPPGPRRDHRPGDLGPDRRQGRRLHLRRRLRRHPGRRAMALREKNPDVAIGLADPYGAALYSWYTARRAEGGGDLDHRGHRPGPDHRQPRGPDDRPRLPDLRRGDAARRIYDLVEHEGLVHGRLDRHQRRRRDPHGPGPGPGQDHRHRALRPRPALSEQDLQSRLPEERGLPTPRWLE